MKTINIHEAKTHLSRLVDQAAQGEEIIIARAGRPVARLVSLASCKEPRRLGLLQDQPFWIAEDFDDADPRIEADFYGDADAT